MDVGVVHGPCGVCSTHVNTRESSSGCSLTGRAMAAKIGGRDEEMRERERAAEAAGEQQYEQGHEIEK